MTPTDKPSLVSKALVELLEKSYKDQVPTLEMSEREIWIRVGQISVVRRLRKMYEGEETS